MHSHPHYQSLHPSKESGSGSLGQTILSSSSDLIQSFRLLQRSSISIILNPLASTPWSQPYKDPALPQSSSDLDLLLPWNIYFVKANQKILKFTRTAGVCFCQECFFHCFRHQKYKRWKSWVQVCVVPLGLSYHQKLSEEQGTGQFVNLFYSQGDCKNESILSLRK